MSAAVSGLPNMRVCGTVEGAEFSRRLDILHAAGMVARTKQGNHARYSITDPSVFELCDQVCGGVRRQLRELEAIVSAA